MARPLSLCALCCCLVAVSPLPYFPTRNGSASRSSSSFAVGPVSPVVGWHATLPPSRGGCGMLTGAGGAPFLACDDSLAALDACSGAVLWRAPVRAAPPARAQVLADGSLLQPVPQGDNRGQSAVALDPLTGFPTGVVPDAGSSGCLLATESHCYYADESSARVVVFPLVAAASAEPPVGWPPGFIVPAADAGAPPPLLDANRSALFALELEGAGDSLSLFSLDVSAPWPPPFAARAMVTGLTSRSSLALARSGLAATLLVSRDGGGGARALQACSWLSAPGSQPACALVDVIPGGFTPAPGAEGCVATDGTIVAVCSGGRVPGVYVLALDASAPLVPFPLPGGAACAACPVIDARGTVFEIGRAHV
jgi:hypothetical protein